LYLLRGTEYEAPHYAVHPERPWGPPSHLSIG
jgi:hypothetical protein